MITNRELTIEDYIAVLRRRLWIILVPLVIAPIIGFAVSYAFAPKYTSTATVLVEQPKVPGSLVEPIITEDALRRISGLEQQVLSRSRLTPVVQSLGLAKSSDEVDSMIADIRSGITIAAVPLTTEATTSASSGKTKGTKKSSNSDVPGFTVSFMYSKPRVAQQVCNQITSMLIEENLKSREQVAQGTTDFLNRQVDEAKRDLDDQDTKLAAFKRHYVGQLPEDADNNLKVLMGLNSQLDASTQTINRAQQDRTYAESVLTQQLAAWKAGASTTSPQALQQQLTALQGQLIQLQARYTDDYPDVIKTKADIAEVQKQLNTVTAAKPDPGNSKVSLAEPPEIQQLRVQIHQYEQAIQQGTAQQKRIQDEIKVYQGRVALSPAVEEEYKKLTRDYDSAQKFYDDLLAKRSQSEMATSMEQQQQGEQFHLLNPAALPSDPSFPNRLLFAGGGAGAGLALGLGLTILLEFKDKAIRNELDVEAVLELPTLICVPWVTGEIGNDSNNKPASREAIEV
ncbi:MAG TPA: Wzz/FepE/Etk N-terminal domain-containing protein [Terriglobales bacterium]|nr:Wzz/FepE/Etk N-terminal domain-containing protein [Terriglobales bacterium]